MKRAVMAGLMVLGFCGLLLADDKKLPAEKSFRGAYPAELCAGVYFEPFEKVNWRSYAPGWIKDFSEKKVSSELLDELYEKRDAFDTIDVSYEVQIPVKMKRYKYYLITGMGVKEFEVQKLEGIARFSFEPSKQGMRGAVSRPLFYGRVFAVSKSAGDTCDGGFVVQLEEVSRISGDYLDPVGRLHATRSSGTAIYVYKQPGKTDAVLMMKEDPAKPAGMHPTEILYQYSVAIDKQRYIFVQWAPDNTGDYGYCQSNYSLFRLDASLKLICVNRYDCDL